MYKRQGIAYNGMVQRAAADRIRGEGYAFPEARQYVVAGFNALSECEKQLFRFLSTAAETDFYWDYDSYYKDLSLIHISRGAAAAGRPAPWGTPPE